MNLWSLRRTLIPFACLLSMGCASSMLIDPYRKQNRQTRALFIAYYPSLTPQQRKALLEKPEMAEELLEEWKIPKLDDRDVLRPHRVKSLSITPNHSKPITGGTSIPLQAQAHYFDGRSADVSNDVVWQVTPALAKIEGSTLHFKCVHSEVSIVAHFFDEFSESSHIQIHKPLRSLKVKIAEVSEAISSNEFIQLQLIAQCADGTQTDVTCQAHWQATPDQGRFLGCGHFQPSLKSHQERWATVTVSYGSTTTTQTISLPRKPKP